MAEKKSNEADNTNKVYTVESVISIFRVNVRDAHYLKKRYSTIEMGKSEWESVLKSDGVLYDPVN